METLVETYDSLSPKIEQFIEKEPMDDPPLLPLCVTTQKAHIEISIDSNGMFVGAKIIPKKYSTTIVPCTEDSSGRTIAISPHPLHDKLQYVAGDYVEYGGSKKHGYREYIELISKWGQSEYAHPRVKIVEKYVERGAVIKDLIDCEVLFLNSSNKLATKEDLPEAEIFELVSSQEDSFIRWEIYDDSSRFSMDKTAWDSWKNYYLNTMTKRGLCSVTGKETVLASNHPAKIRNSGDKAKIISSNDLSGFTYRGRFERAEQLCAVGYEGSQKAHSALRWLIGRQGYRNEGLAIVSWATTGNVPPSVMSDISVCYEDDLLADNPQEIMAGFTGEDDAKIFRNMLRGYYREFAPEDDIVVMALNSATPGRLSILLFRELSGSDYLDRIAKWNDEFSWLHSYRYKIVDGKKHYFSFIGAPALRNIAEASLGIKADSTLINHMTERLLPCIVDGVPIPSDIVKLSIGRASSPPSTTDNAEMWEWNKTMSIACSLFKGANKKEEYKVPLEEDRKSRDYLYGRLLAVADRLESAALKEAKEKRQTTALRYMQRFRDRPYNTWVNIELSLSPYVVRLGGLGQYYIGIISKITDMFEHSDFTNDKQLSGEFLLGFHSQREWFFKKKPEEEKEEEEKEEQ